MTVLEFDPATLEGLPESEVERFFNRPTPQLVVNHDA